MADPDQVAMLKRSVEEWNTWRSQNWEACDLRGVVLRGGKLVGVHFNGMDLSYADLRDAELEGADLRGVRFVESKLDNTKLHRVVLHEADLRGASLLGATLRYSRIEFAHLDECDLRGADLSDASLYLTSVRGANFADASFGGTAFFGMDLSSAQGLDKARHSKPSALDLHTLTRSGRLPLTFYRGCGLSDAVIDYLPSLLSEAIQFYSVFISFSSKDQVFADRLHADLQNSGVRCWFAPHDIKSGKTIHEQIDEAIRIYERLLLILSSASMASSWVRDEIRRARQKEKESRRRVLFPVSLVPFDPKLKEWEFYDMRSGENLAEEVRAYYVPDFTGWETDHARYKAAFDKLLKGLRAEP